MSLFGALAVVKNGERVAWGLNSPTGAQTHVSTGLAIVDRCYCSLAEGAGALHHYTIAAPHATDESKITLTARRFTSWEATQGASGTPKDVYWMAIGK